MQRHEELVFFSRPALAAALLVTIPLQAHCDCTKPPVQPLLSQKKTADLSHYTSQVKVYSLEEKGELPGNIRIELTHGLCTPRDDKNALRITDHELRVIFGAKIHDQKDSLFWLKKSDELLTRLGLCESEMARYCKTIRDAIKHPEKLESGSDPGFEAQNILSFDLERFTGSNGAPMQHRLDVRAFNGDLLEIQNAIFDLEVGE